MFADYISLVLEDYRRKQSTNRLSILLVRPTPGNLKKECLAVFKKRFNRKDEQALRTFFEHSGDAKSFFQVIERFETDKFRPLVNFLRNQTTNTEDKNIELLAWLIDFEKRPFELGETYRANTGEIVGRKEEGPIDFDDNTEDPSVIGCSYQEPTKEVYEPKPIPYGKPYSKFKTKIVIASLSVVIVVVVSLYLLKSDKKQKFILKGEERCMYWTGDHYQVVSCSQKMGDTLVVALDSVRLVQFKRITTPDTITWQSKRKVWYLKRDGNLEFFTAGGYHPVYPQLRLRPITDHIIDRYIDPAQ